MGLGNRFLRRPCLSRNRPHLRRSSPMPRRCTPWFLLAVCWLAAPTASAQNDAAADAFFEKEVRPLLVDRCLACHGGAKVKGGLKMTSRAALLAGGDSGPAAV